MNAPLKRTRLESMASPRQYSFGGTAAIVTSVGLIVGFGAASVSRAAIVGGLVIIGLADNLSDSLSIHLYQESEHLDARAALRATITNFVARLLVALSFVVIVLALPMPLVPLIAIGWGLILLGGLTYVLSRDRNVSASKEIRNHSSSRSWSSQPVGYSAAGSLLRLLDDLPGALRRFTIRARNANPHRLRAGGRPLLVHRLQSPSARTGEETRA